jgi:hypothetical protein
MQLGALLLAVGSALVAALIAVAGSHLNPHSGIERPGKANIFEFQGSAHRQIMSLSPQRLTIPGENTVNETPHALVNL